MAIQVFYECKDCKKTYSETREVDHPQWFTQCDLCGGEYKEVASSERPDPVIITPAE